MPSADEKGEHRVANGLKNPEPGPYLSDAWRCALARVLLQLKRTADAASPSGGRSSQLVRHNITGTSMKRFLLPIAASLFVSQVCLAEGVYKCTSEAGVTYQSAPCTDGFTTVLVAPPGDNVVARAGLDSVAALAPSIQAVPPSIYTNADGLQPGMTDLQVLNNRLWGKPQRITRNREARAWHEHWTYDVGPNGGKRLHFVNGKLADVATLESPVSGVGLAPVTMLVGL